MNDTNSNVILFKKNHITNNKFASPIVQIGATPDYELFKKSIAKFLAAKSPHN